MTVALCANCGSLKHGAWCPCPECKEDPFDGEIGILLSDNHLTKEELKRIGVAVALIHKTHLDEETRFYVLMFFMCRKWPKLLEFDIDAVPADLRGTLDSVYREKLADVPGQDSSDLQVSPIARISWEKALGEPFQTEDDRWQESSTAVLMRGNEVAKNIVRLQIDTGEGATVQRLWHAVKSLLQSYDYRILVGRAEENLGDAKAYQREVGRFCQAVCNGWSNRTKEQAAYFLGLCVRLVEMAERSKTIIEHKARIRLLITLDFRRAKQQFNQGYMGYIELAKGVLDPNKIPLT